MGLKQLLVGIQFLVLVAAISSFGSMLPEIAMKPIQIGKGFQLDVENGGKPFAAKPTKSSAEMKSILGNDFYLIVADVDKNGEPTFHRWTSYKSHTRNAIRRHRDAGSEAKGTFRIQSDRTTHQKKNMENLVKDHGVEFIANETSSSKNDYLKIPHNVTYSENIFSGSVEVTVEFVIVADFELCNIFKQNYDDILDYFTIYMWHVNLLFKTLPSAKINFQLNGVVAISSPEAQPFIEKSRAEDGRVAHGRVLNAFGTWVHENRANLPPLDIASVITAAAQEWGGGLAWVGTACMGRDNYFYGTSVWNDGGDWGSVGIASHELGHNLGAGHDGDSGCPHSNLNGSWEHQFYFSNCSDKWIGDFVRSDGAKCLRELSVKNPTISPDFEIPLAPSMSEQCKRRVKVEESWTTNEGCVKATCNWRNNDLPPGWFWYTNFGPIDNSPCGDNGRCFRGKCRKPGYLFKNMGTGLCMEASNPFHFEALVQMVECPRVGTASSRFTIVEGLKGTFLESPFIENGNNSVEKCLYTGSDWNRIWTDRCGNHSSSDDNAWRGWEFVQLGGNQFMLKHKLTGRCASAPSDTVGSWVYTYASCERNNRHFRWTTV